VERVNRLKRQLTVANVLSGPGSVTNSKLAKKAVTESKLAAESVSTRVGWVAGGREVGSEDETNSWQVIAYAVCAEL
jgi:hypothetical protein